MPWRPSTPQQCSWRQVPRPKLLKTQSKTSGRLSGKIKKQTTPLEMGSMSMTGDAPPQPKGDGSMRKTISAQTKTQRRSRTGAWLLKRRGTMVCWLSVSTMKRSLTHAQPIARKRFLVSKFTPSTDWGNTIREGVNTLKLAHWNSIWTWHAKRSLMLSNLKATAHSRQRLA